MPYLSHILGRRVVDSVGQPVGHIVDLAITTEEPFGGEFPPVTLALVRAGSLNLRLRWELIADLSSTERGTVCLLDQPRARITIGQEKGGEVFLRRDVLDKQIFDLSNTRLVRVNDIFLIEDGRELRAAGVDVSLRGLLRRVRLERALMAVTHRLHISLHRQHIPWNQVEVTQTEKGGRIQSKVPTDKLSRLHPADLANIVHQMTPVERAELFEQLDVETAAEALEEVDDEVAADIVEGMDNERAADIIEEMDPDEAADVLGEMDSVHAADAILQAMDDPEEAADIKHLLSYPDGTAGALMTTDVITLSRGSTAAEALAHLRQEQPEPSALHYVHVTDVDNRLTGVVSLAEVVLAGPDTPLETLLHDELLSVQPDTDADECARLISRYALLSLPVVDIHGHLLGIVTIDDVVDIGPEDARPRAPHVMAMSE